MSGLPLAVYWIGATGCGKSAVINLIPRLYDATEGEILVDGVNVRDYKQYDLRNRIGYVSQKAVLFTGSNRSNVAYGDNGRPGSELNQGVADAVETAQAREFVDALPGNTEGFVAQGGFYADLYNSQLAVARLNIEKQPSAFAGGCFMFLQIWQRGPLFANGQPSGGAPSGGTSGAAPSMGLAACWAAISSAKAMASAISASSV